MTDTTTKKVVYAPPHQIAETIVPNDKPRTMTDAACRAAATYGPDERQERIERLEQLSNELLVGGWSIHADQADVNGAHLIAADVAEHAIEKMVVHLLNFAQEMCAIGNKELMANTLDAMAYSAYRMNQKARNRLSAAMHDEREQIRAIDGSEVTDYQLQRLTANRLACEQDEQQSEIAVEAIARAYSSLAGRAWLPPTGIKTSVHMRSAAVFTATHLQEQRSEKERRALTIPQGAKFIITGGYNRKETVTSEAVLNCLDRLHKKHTDLVLLLTDEPGASRTAQHWAAAKNIPFTIIRADFKRDHKAAPFRRNRALIAAKPRGIIAFPGNGITENLCDEAKKANIPVWQPVG